MIDQTYGDWLAEIRPPLGEDGRGKGSAKLPSAPRQCCVFLHLCAMISSD